MRRGILLGYVGGPAFAWSLVAGTATTARAVSCDSAGTFTVAVSYAPPAGKTIAGIKLALDYPKTVKIPGFADSDEVKERISGLPEGFLSSPNDRDDGLILALVGTGTLTAGRVATIEFDRCKGAPAPVIAEFRCKVEQASTDGGVLVDGSTCTATAIDAEAGRNRIQAKEVSR